MDKSQRLEQRIKDAEFNISHLAEKVGRILSHLGLEAFYVSTVPGHWEVKPKFTESEKGEKK